MYIPSDFKNKFELTPEEIQKEQVTFERLLQLVSKADQISSSMRSHNNYGEFRFVTLWIGNTRISLYGHGVHENRGIEYGEHFVVYEYIDFGYGDKTKKLIYGEVVEELMREHKNYPTDYRRGDSQTQVFNMLADLTDDDAAYSEFADNGWEA
jgi:hypothetical protein